ncbi:MAG: FAD synthase [Candidatus Diapherotrites archaeon]|nr:FAD synthase [Candidatus Diapherotrites archaeon]
MRKVMAFGTFDVLHPGHVKYLEAARALGDYLVVIVTTDKNVEKFKGKKPVYPQDERAQIVGALRCVDEAVVGYEDDFYRTVEKFRPDILALGYDMRESEKEVEEKISGLGLKCGVKRIPAFRPEHHKSSKIKENIRK